MDVRPTADVRPQAAVRRRRWLALLFAVVLLEAGAIGWVYWVERARLRRDQYKTFMRQGAWSDRYEFIAAGIVKPPTLAAGEAKLSDDEEVVGLVAGGKARAYRLAAMRGREQHIVNDLVDDRPISVTYCDTAECIRAYAGAPGGAPIEMEQGGLKGQRMVLRFAGAFYLQDTGERLDAPNAQATGLPFQVYPITRTTWGAWRGAHPETDVFAGLPDEPQ